MVKSRRLAEESRTLLIEAAVKVIRTEGYAAVTARRVADLVGMSRQIVPYYFRTTQELLLAVVRHYGDTGLARLEAAFAIGDPLRVLWEEEPDASATATAFTVLAGHEPTIAAEVRKYMDAFREMQVKAIERHFRERGVTLVLPAEVIAIIIQGIAHGLAAETGLGRDQGHAETRAVVEQMLDSLQVTGKISAG
ncbi:TetR/AcrR family transcriptional regulator [Novosphingobium sp. G106]|uniref:TetR/AcrR family transcriptional regulator n=1 Tax=Novosphingobium sp. G106 TaxID=2849500 RepID=UPI001C2D4994|nr:TetR/AcrR family transcriptional regulator [Novosphingobium sp. G106]MBV1688400.1 TetR/AcrR family transcriptional regulator [Novosphingobium sp. G106]